MNSLKRKEPENLMLQPRLVLKELKRLRTGQLDFSAPRKEEEIEVMANAVQETLGPCKVTELSSSIHIVLALE